MNPGGIEGLLPMIGTAAAAIGSGVVGAITFGDDRGPVRLWMAKHAAQFDRDLRFLRADMTGTQLASLQLGGIAAILLLAFLLDEPLLAMIAPILWLAPKMVLESRRRERITKIEEQLDTWLLSLASSLKATPSLGEGIAFSAELVGGPVAQELDIVVKETHLGVPLDDAVRNLARRIDSVIVSGALTAVIVGRQTGGNLPQILEETAGTLREIARLEGQLRAKTASARAQAYVMLAIPFLIIGALHYIDPEWLTPLTTTTMGNLIAAAAAGLWLTAVVISRTILNVEM